MIWALWWVWMVAALALAFLEVLVPGYIFLGFALGAAATGLTVAVGGPVSLWLSGSLPAALLFFAICSLIAWIALRKIVGVRKGQVKIWDRDINDD
ncbi:MAG: hypothetical protein AAFQ79_00050 [Pseudomonadota bacterium]